MDEKCHNFWTSIYRPEEIKSVPVILSNNYVYFFLVFKIK